MAAPEVHREIERKLEVPDEFVVPDLAATGVVAAMTQRSTLTLVAVYFDTADLRLARQRITLRRRTGGEDDGWHLKLPPTDAGDEARDEVQLPLDQSATPPMALLDLVRHLLDGQPLGAVATVRNQRARFELIGHDGRTLAELTDDHVDATRADGTVVSFRELEVEAAPSRSSSDLDTVVAALVTAGAALSSFASKAVRALGPLAAPS